MVMRICIMIKGKILNLCQHEAHFIEVSSKRSGVVRVMVSVEDCLGRMLLGPGNIMH